jgi:hypothetical protein
MAKKDGGSAFDEILNSFADSEDRETFTDLADRNPRVREYGLRQSDYSRSMDQLRKERTEHEEDLDELTEWRNWRNEHWDADARMTKRELARYKEVQALKDENTRLQNQLLLEGEDVNFEQLEKWSDEIAAKKGYITRDDISRKEQELKEFVAGGQNWLARAATTVPYLNQRHDKEFGEPFDPDKFLSDAVTKGRFNDLKEYYEEWVAPQRQEKQKAHSTKEIEEAKAEAEKQKKRADDAELRVAGGPAPVDVEGSDMAPFQRQYLGLDKKPEGSSGAPEVPLGEGAIASYAARQFIDQQRSSGR